MKTLLIIFGIIILINFRVNSQNLGEIGTEWYYSEHAGGACPGNCEYLFQKSTKDTIINGISVHKISRTYYQYSGDTTELTPLFIYQSNDTAYIYNVNRNKFLKFLIFNKSKGDTLFLDNPYIDAYPWPSDSTYRLVIDTVEAGNIEGIQIKKYRTIGLDGFQYFSNGYFWDYIGGIDWFYPRGAIILEAGGPIRCFHNSQIDTNFQQIPCDYRLIQSIENIKQKDKFIISPNPTNDILNLMTNQEIKSIEIVNILGEILIKSELKTININQLNQGVYYMIIHTKTDEIFNLKIIKNAR